MRKISQVLTLIVLFAISTQAQTYQKTDRGIKISIKSTAVEIQFYAPSTVRVLKSPEGTAFTIDEIPL